MVCAIRYFVFIHRPLLSNFYHASRSTPNAHRYLTFKGQSLFFQTLPNPPTLPVFSTAVASYPPRRNPIFLRHLRVPLNTQLPARVSFAFPNISSVPRRLCELTRFQARERGREGSCPSFRGVSLKARRYDTEGRVCAAPDRARI